MDYDTWSPVYLTILEAFGFDRAGDERARDVLADLVGPFDDSRLAFDGETVAVAGGAPTLAAESEVLERADRVVAASVAADVCLETGVDVDLFVTDLDKNPETAVELSRAGVPVAAHAHADNVPLVREVVPEMRAEHVLGTTQAEPRGPVVNHGGFTDGDRAAFLADAFGAAELVFPGWAFDDPDVDPMKARKLGWAERLLYWLERRRGDRFGLLEGRRDGIDTSWLP
jgi:uncharacterized Rossmann fold enzyme